MPNRAARALTTGRTRTIGLVVADIANPFFPPLVKAAQSRARESDYALFLADTDEDQESERRAIRRFATQVDGLILCSSRLDESTIQKTAQDTGVVLVNRSVPGITSVLIDSGDGMGQAVKHLHALGHRSLAYLGGPEVSWSNQQRQESVREHARESDVDVHLFGPYLANYEAGRQAVDLVLNTDASAILAYDDLMALGVLARLRERRVEVPDKMSVVGCDDVLPIGMAPVPLTTVAARCDVAGRAAVDALLAVLDSESLEPRQVLLPTQLIVRNSTGLAHGA